MKIHESIIISINEVKKKKAEKKIDPNKPREFEISQLYNYLKSYIVAKFKVGEVKLKELKLDKDYFYVVMTTFKEKVDPNYISKEIGSALSKKLELKDSDINISVKEESNKNYNLVITVEYKKGE